MFGGIFLAAQCSPSRLTEAVVQPAYPVNVGNMRDTGHSTQPTRPAAKAEEETVSRPASIGGLSAFAAARPTSKLSLQ